MISLKVDSTSLQNNYIINKNGYIKVKIGLCRGKNLFDKRESLKKKSQKREMDRAIKQAL